MAERAPVLVFSPHPDDWQIFAGSAVYDCLRDDRVRVCVVNVTAGDAGLDDFHWKARHSGAVIALLRGLESWSPYAIAGRPAPPLPCSFGVSTTRIVPAGKPVLRTSVRCGESEAATIYSLHLPDGRGDGIGFPPRNESLAKLRDGGVLHALWPEDERPVYASWPELMETFEGVVRDASGGYTGTIQVYAPDPDAIANPGDHSDHRLTGIAIREMCSAMPALVPAWMTMYAIKDLPKNLGERAAMLQRAAIVAYGCGYAATVAGTANDWRRGWERELEAYQAREYLRAPTAPEDDAGHGAAEVTS